MNHLGPSPLDDAYRKGPLSPLEDLSAAPCSLQNGCILRFKLPRDSSAAAEKFHTVCLANAWTWMRLLREMRLPTRRPGIETSSSVFLWGP